MYVVILAILIGGIYLLRRAKSFKAGMAIGLATLVLISLVVGSQP